MRGREFQPIIDRINDPRHAEAQSECGIRQILRQEVIFHHTTFLLGRTSSGLRVPHRDATLHETEEGAQAERQKVIVDLPGTYVGELREGERYSPWGTGGSLVHGKSDKTHGSEIKK